MTDLSDEITNAKEKGVNMGQGSERPLVTFFLFVYNQEKFVRYAVESALTQTYRPIQFIFSDDCSTDRTYEIMCEVIEKHEGNENIILNRNERNLGVVDHLNKVIFELAKGKYIVPMAGDDITSPDRTEKVVALFEETGASAVAVNPEMIDEVGRELGKRLYSIYPSGILHFEEYFVKGAPFFGGGGYARDLFETYGPMKNSTRNEDVILPCRASTLGGIAYLGDPVYFYREHGNNMSFWVKIKRDPVNSTRYEIASRKNALQNLANFKQEVRESYQGRNKSMILAQIDIRYNRARFELALFESGFLPKLALVPSAFRIGNNPREILRLLLICLSPRFYLLLHAARQAFRQYIF